MSKMPRKEMDEEIGNVIGTSKVIDWNDLVTIMSKMQKGNFKDQELKETFRIIDKRDRGTISFQEFKHALQSHVAVPITEYEINELLDAANVDASNGITFNDFVKMINL
jgi:Ca2+-binding EF-hand superfamily protein